jgi:hypothetical protein
MRGTTFLQRHCLKVTIILGLALIAGLSTSLRLRRYPLRQLHSTAHLMPPDRLNQTSQAETRAPETAGLSTPTSAAQSDQAAGQAAQARLDEAYGNLPLSFEANRGQTDEQVRFLTRANGSELFLTATEAVLTLRNANGRGRNGKDTLNPHSASSDPQTAVLRIKLEGANPEPQVSGQAELPGKTNYFTGHDPKKWRTGIPTFARVKYSDAYPGIDLVYYGNNRHLEYDFIVAPGVDPGVIRLSFQGADTLKLDERGDLILSTAAGDVRQPRPTVYQEADGTRHEVAGRYEFRGNREIGFRLEEYDRTRPLVIDPELIYSTFLGGSQDDEGRGIVIDAEGNAYITGLTLSTDFPTANAFQSVKNVSGDVFVTKLNPAGTAIVYSTYIGGSGMDAGFGIAVDSSGSAYVTGSTASSNFPLVNPFHSTFGPLVDAFVTKLNPTGDALVYSTYLGGSDFDEGHAIAVDASGNAYVTGYTVSRQDFPTADPIQPVNGNASNGSAWGDAFVTKLNPAGSALIFSTYLGGSTQDQGNGIAVDQSGNVYVAGFAESDNFPLHNPLQSQLLGYRDAFVAKFAPAGTSLIYSTYLGGPGLEIGGGASNDTATAITADADGNAYVTGWTESYSFPTTTNVFQPAKPPVGYAVKDVFVTKFNPAGSALLLSTYFGGSEDDEGRGIALDASRNIYLTGRTDSNNFPNVDAYQVKKSGTIASGSQKPTPNAFVAKLSADASAPVYSTYLAGTRQALGTGIAVDAGGTAYVTGLTEAFTCETGVGACNDFPTFNALQPNPGGRKDAFVARLAADKGFNISGRVLDHFGQPRSRVKILVTGTLTRTVIPDANGYYHTGSLRAGGDYTLTPVRSALDFEPQSQSFTNLRGDVTGVNFTGTQLYFTISGHVADNNGAALGGVTVELNGSRTKRTKTDASGNYSFTVPGGYCGYQLDTGGASYSVFPVDGVHIFKAQGAFEFCPMEENKTADFVGTVPPPAPNVTLSGKVTDVLGNPMSGVTINLGGGRVESTVTNEAGLYSFTQLPSLSSYQVSASKLGFYFNPPTYYLQGLGSGYTANFQQTVVPRVNTAPSGYILLPRENNTFLPSSNITIEAGAEDSDGVVTKVEFFANIGVGGTPVKIGEVTTSPYIFVWNNVPAGNYAITVSSTDNAGAKSSGPQTHIMVGNYTPTVSITSPPNPSTFSHPPSSFFIEAGARPANGSTNGLSQVEFYVGSTQIDIDNLANYFDGQTYFFGTVFDNVQPGTYTLTAKVVDSSGATATSEPVTVTVQPRPLDTSISGRVTTSNGQALGGVTITLSGSQSGTTTTDANGNYSFTSLTPSGSYTIAPSKTGYSFDIQSRTFNSLSSNQTANFTGSATGMLSGKPKRRPR